MVVDWSIFLDWFFIMTYDSNSRLARLSSEPSPDAHPVETDPAAGADKLPNGRRGTSRLGELDLGRQRVVPDDGPAASAERLGPAAVHGADRAASRARRIRHDGWYSANVVPRGSSSTQSANSPIKLFFVPRCGRMRRSIGESGTKAWCATRIKKVPCWKQSSL